MYFHLSAYYNSYLLKKVLITFGTACAGLYQNFLTESKFYLHQSKIIPGLKEANKVVYQSSHKCLIL
jgi:hypothetical protein